jgi:HAD superfamily hydrolase (TIGR01459 family)
MNIKQLHHIAEIADKYDIFFVDLWGVIHDGVEAYPGVHEALASLKQAGKKVIFISNAPRRAFRAVEGLRNLNIADDLYDNVVTSGEVTFEYLKNVRGEQWIVDGNHYSPPTAHYSRYIILGPDRDNGLLDGAGYEKVLAVKDADFMVVTGFDHDDSNMDEMQPYLDEAIKLNLPLICANPDLIVVRLSGKRALCAGVIANKYAEMGGYVTYFGKPYKEVYERAMQLVGSVPKNRIAAIGDSLLNDIKGANDFGIDSYLIPGGIAGEELGIVHGQLPTQEKLKAFCDKHGVTPTGVLARFVF